MSEPTPIHPIRQRMIDDMTLRGFSALTQKSYMRIVRNCLAHVGKPPKDLSVDDARGFLLHLQQSGTSVSTINSASVALRFFLRVTLGRAEHIERIPILREPKLLPPVLREWGLRSACHGGDWFRDHSQKFVGAVRNPARIRTGS